MKLHKYVLFGAAFSVISLCSVQPSYGEFIWNSKIGKFMRVGQEIKATDKEQYAYIESLIQEKDIDLAIIACDDLRTYFEGSPLIPDALFKKGTLLEQKKEYFKAFQAYQTIMDNYPLNYYTNRILLRQFDIGVKFYEGERYRLVGVPTVPMQSKAIEIFKAVKENAPFNEYGEKAHYYWGLALEKQGKYLEAFEMFQDMIDEHPDTTYAADASFRMANLVYKISQKNYEDEKTMQSAKEKFDEFVGMFPDDVNAVKEAKKRKLDLMDKEAEHLYKIARYYEGQRRLESANLYYAIIVTDCPTTKWAKKAEKRMKMFADPATELEQRGKALAEELASVEQDMSALKVDKSRTDFEIEWKQLKEKHATLQDEIKEYNKQKIRELKLREQVLKRKERELKVQRKTLELKKEHFQQQQPEGYTQVVKQMEKEINDQQFLLTQERDDLDKLFKKFGYGDNSLFGLLALNADAINVGKYTAYKYEAIKALYETSLNAREQRQNLLTAASDMTAAIESIRQAIDEGTEIAFQQGDVTALLSEDDGTGTWQRLVLQPVKMLVYPSKLILPGVGGQLEELTNMRDVLHEREDETKRAIAEIERLRGEQEQVVESAIQPQTDVNTVNRSQERSDDIEKRKVRSTIKNLEKQINEQYRIIDDAEKAKIVLTKQLLAAVQTETKKRLGLLRYTALQLLRPFAVVKNGVSMFLFGIPEEALVAQGKANKLARKEEESDDALYEELNNSITLENEKIQAGQRKIKQLYKELDGLERESGGIFKSIIMFPVNIFADTDMKEEKNIVFLDRFHEKQTQRLEVIQEKLTEVDAKIREIEQEQQAAADVSVAKQEAVAVAGSMPTVVAIADDFFSSFKEMRKEGMHLLKQEEEALEEEESLQKEKREKIDAVIAEFNGAENDKMKALFHERKVVFERLDTITMQREQVANGMNIMNEYQEVVKAVREAL